MMMMRRMMTLSPGILLEPLIVDIVRSQRVTRKSRYRYDRMDWHENRLGHEGDGSSASDARQCGGAGILSFSFPYDINDFTSAWISRMAFSTDLFRSFGCWRRDSVALRRPSLQHCCPCRFLLSILVAAAPSPSLSPKSPTHTRARCLTKIPPHYSWPQKSPTFAL